MLASLKKSEEVMKRKISLMLAMILMLSSLTNIALAEEVTENESMAEASGILSISIADAVKLATESDREMWEIDNGIKEARDARRQGRDAKETAKALMEMPLSALDAMEASGSNVIDNQVDLILAKNGYYVTLADTQIVQLEKSKDVLIKGIEAQTKSLYYNVLLAEKSVEINQAKLNNATEQLRVVNLKFNNGSATKAEVLSSEIAVQQAKTDIDTAMDELNTAKLNLLNRLDLPLNQEIVLTEKELSYVPTEKLDLNEAIEKAREDRPEILTAENNLKLQEIKTHADTAYYTSNMWQSQVAVKQLENAKLNVPQAYKDVELDVRKAYLNLVEAERSLVNMNKTVELAKESSRINKLLYENGMATSLDVLDADTNLAQAEIGQYQLLAAYNMNKMVFDNSNLIGTTVGK